MVLLAVLMRLLFFVLSLVTALVVTGDYNLNLQMFVMMVVGSRMSLGLSKDLYSVVYEEFPTNVPTWMSHYFLPPNYLFRFTYLLCGTLFRAFVPVLVALSLYRAGMPLVAYSLIWLSLDLFLWRLVQQPLAPVRRWISWQSKLLFFVIGGATVCIISAPWFLGGSSGCSSMVVALTLLEVVQYLFEKGWINLKNHAFHLDSDIPVFSSLAIGLGLLSLRSLLSYYLLQFGCGRGIVALVLVLVCADFLTQVAGSFADNYIYDAVND